MGRDKRIAAAIGFAIVCQAGLLVSGESAIAGIGTAQDDAFSALIGDIRKFEYRCRAVVAETDPRYADCERDKAALLARQSALGVTNEQINASLNSGQAGNVRDLKVDARRGWRWP